MKRVLPLAALCTLLACQHAAPVPVPAPTVVPPPAQLDASTPLHDRGTFRLLQDEEPIDETEFTLESTGAYHAHSASEEVDVVASGKRSGWQRADLRLRNREPLHFEHLGDDVVSRTSGRTLRFVAGAEAPFIELRAPALLELVLRAYDAHTGGVQRIPVFLAPQRPEEAVVTRGKSSERLLKGSRVILFEFDVELSGELCHVSADGAGRIYQATLPEEHLRFVREGFEAQFPPPPAAGVLHAVRVQRGEHVAMRDGTQLTGDVYRPDDLPRAPALLLRTELGRETFAPTARFYARRGYVVVVQDMRGRGASRGTWAPFAHEAEDGEDTVAWLAQRPDVNGEVALIGNGYGAWAALATLGHKPRALKAVVSSDALLHALPDLSEVETPVLHLGQQPRHASEALRDFALLAAAGARAQKLLVTRVHGPVDLPTESLRWLDHHLRGADDRVTREPAVQVAIDGSSETVRAERYPLAEETAPLARWYFVSGGKAISSLGDGTLSSGPPRAGRPDHYTFNPAAPTPDPELFVPEPDAPGSEHVDAEEQARRLGNHEDIVSNRQDILVYATAPLSAALTLVGPVRLQLFVDTQGPDTSLFASLVEVDARGFVTELARGEAQAHAAGGKKKPAEVLIELGDVAVSVAAGHRLRVELASARFGPGQTFPAGGRRTEVRVHHERSAQSQLELHALRAEPRPVAPSK